jgi:hypothetical protein
MSSTLVSLADEHRAAAEQVLGSVRSKFDLAFYSGSLAVGLGHATSDVDIHIVLAEGVHLERRTFDVGQHAIQLTAVPLSRLRYIAELGSRLTATARHREQFELDSGLLWDMMRTGSGVLIEGSGEAATLFGSINVDVVRQVIMGNHAHPVGRFAKDAYGLLGVGDVRSAYVCAIQALGNAVELALAAGGDLYTLPKFQFARLARSIHAAQANALWQLLYAGPATPTAEDLERRLWAAGSLVADGLLNGWDSVLTTVPPLEPVGSGVIRSPYWGLMRFADGYALAGPAKPLRVSAPVARLWSILDGRPFDDLVHASGAESADQVTAAIAHLVRSGAVLDKSRTSE